MSPIIAVRADGPDGHSWDGSWKHDLPIEGYILEAWSQGCMVGALVIMAGVTIANMTNVLLHKLILIELILAVFHGTFCFMDFSGYGWYVSSTAILLYSSWYMHNIIAWIKIKPFLRPQYSRIFIFSFLLTTPYWVLETYGNFAFNNNISRIFLRTRPFEALCRDPWWIFTCINLIYNIRKKYNMSVVALVRTSPRFGVMLVSMALSIVFLIVDVLSTVIQFGAVVGINPYWKLSLIFKCFCDTIILDDFRSAIEKIRARYFSNVENQGAHLGEFGTTTKGSSHHNGSNPMGNQVNIKSVPKMYGAKLDQEQPAGGKGRKFGGILGGHKRLDSEDAHRIYISTDVITNREHQDRPDDASAESSGPPPRSSGEW